MTITQNIIKAMWQPSILLEKEVSELKAQLEQRHTDPPDYEYIKRKVQELRERPVEVAIEKYTEYDSTKQKLAQLETDAAFLRYTSLPKLSCNSSLKVYS